MCLTDSDIQSLQKWNWDGDHIIFNPVIDSSRCVPGTEKRFDTDIREFLSNKDNAVIRRELRKLVDRMAEKKKAFFRSRALGSFDFRVQKILEYVAENIAYEYKDLTIRKCWLYPEETLATKSGDCEDRSFLLASMILASGVSGYCVRVVLGKIVDGKNGEPHDHVWVMYKNETGRWMLLESQLFVGEGRDVPVDRRRDAAASSGAYLEYLPYFLFNNDHMWSVLENTGGTTFGQYLAERGNFWRDFDPCFAGAAHNSIFDRAFSEMGWLKRLWLKSVSVAVDVLPNYNPLIHFDNGYIPEGWDLVQKNLDAKNLTGLATAAHSIADFYAHSTYACFAKEKGDSLVTYDSDHLDDCCAGPISYSGPRLDLRNFSYNKRLFKGSEAERIRLLNEKKIISGRYAQEDAKGLIENVWVRFPGALKASGDYAWRGALPRHDEIAVDKYLRDKDPLPGKHKIYKSREEYNRQFELRCNAAVDHIKEIISRNESLKWIS